MWGVSHGCEQQCVGEVGTVGLAVAAAARVSTSIAALEEVVDEHGRPMSLSWLPWWLWPLPSTHPKPELTSLVALLTSAQIQTAGEPCPSG